MPISVPTQWVPYGSYLNWMQVGTGDMGFIPNADGAPIPSSPYNISTVAITEKFAPLIGLAVTLKNDLRFNAEYRDGRTLTLNSDAGQLVEANTRNITAGVGYKIVGFNTVLKMRGSGQGISNDLTINADFSYQQTQALIRRIEDQLRAGHIRHAHHQFNLSASYVMSRRMTISAYIDHQINTPLISSLSLSDHQLQLRHNLQPQPRPLIPWSIRPILPRHRPECQ